MQRRALLAIVCASAAAYAPVAVARESVGKGPSPPETILPPPPVEAVGKAATPWMRTQLARLRGPLRPAQGPRSLVVARLRLLLAEGSGHAWFVTYRSRGGHLCGSTFESQPFSSGWTTGGLPCSGPCGQICTSGTVADLDAGWLVYSATAPTTCDGFRLTLTDGSRFRFPLTGPSVRGAPDRRVVLVQLTTKASVVVAEALRGDEVIASQSYLPREALRP
jgi:hypothetical protein